MRPSRKRHWFVKQYSVDSVLYKWFNKKRAHNISIRGPVLLQNAVNFATKLEDSNFKTNAGWRFKSRHGTVCRSVCCESSAIDIDIEHDWKNNKPSELIKGFKQRDIIIANETGLFYKWMLPKTLQLKSEKCSSGKRSKDKLTLLVCN